MGESRHLSCTWLTSSVTIGVNHDKIQPKISAAQASVSHRRLAWGHYGGLGDSRVAFSIQEALSFGDPGPGDSSGTVAFSTRNQGKQLWV